VSEDGWTLERVEAELPELAPLARLHGVLADETLRFATGEDGPAPRPAFAGPPALHWFAGRSLIDAADRAVLADLVGGLAPRLLARLRDEFEEVSAAASEVLDAVGGIDWADWIGRFRAAPAHGEVPHPALFRFVLLRALSAPATHLARAFSPPHADRWQRTSCPYCGVPAAASLAQAGSARLLLCVLCGGRWARDTLACVACGEDRKDRLRVLANPDAGPASLEACDTCRTAIKVFAASALDAGPPLALEVLTVRLDMLAERVDDVRRNELALAAVYPPA
jgi:FdhE protein